jgi:diguanylate cyclase (GGDEF)-like protein/PAS domain S-box-containing protein
MGPNRMLPWVRAWAGIGCARSPAATSTGVTPGSSDSSPELLGLLVAAVRDYAIVTLDLAGNVASWNAGAEHLNGYRAHEIIGKHFSVLYPAEDVAADKPDRDLITVAATGRLENEGWRVRKDGTRFWANVIITALRDDAGSLRGFGNITRDRTERRRAELALRESEERFRLMVEGVQDYAILMLDAAGNVATWNAGARRLKGYDSAEIIGKHFSRFYSADDTAAGKPARLLATATANGRVEDEGWRIRKDGTRFWANVVITALRDGDGVLLGFGKITRDLTERRSHERRLQEMADQDPLTGVLNRRSFGRELHSHAARVARYGSNGSVFMVDLDNFKHFNDTRGHSAGDELMVRIARGLQSRLRQSDVLARLGGDEFAILLPGGDPAAAETLADSLLDVVREQDPLAANGPDHRISASIGIACFDDGTQLTPDDVMANADRAMYAAKRAGRDRWVRYRPTRDRD